MADDRDDRNEEGFNIAQVTADLLGLADVHRWNVVKMARTQSVAEHSFNVAVITMDLMSRLGIGGDRNMVMALTWSLVHDAPEVLSGDIDGKFKRDFPLVTDQIRIAEQFAFPWYKQSESETSPMIRAIVKLADRIEAITFLRVWGIGGRADHIATEMYKSTFNYTIPAVCNLLSDVSVPVLGAAVQDIIDSTLTERDTIEFRG